MADLGDPTYWIPIVVSIIAVFPLYLDLWNRRKSRPIEFEFERFMTESNVPDSEWSFRILHPERLIQRCTILFNGNPLVWWDGKNPPYQRKIVAGGGGIVRLPKGVDPTYAEIRVKDGNKTLKVMKFEDVLLTEP